MDKPIVTVSIDENGAVAAVDMEGHPPPVGVVETVDSQPIPSFGDEEFSNRLRPWLAG